ncbi:hypothetical protein B0H17DRAFT_1337126 [Mycena rosella]|uniref:Uncharacterized protein n=1 Tax=Mycena rosella TaxID=1033263 RepID=A0AAD7G3B2_MYCRO|nr:hypothetical protein B0H17DRAFT_1337126 [Mycena rosella]
MSLVVDGVSVTSISYASSPRTALSLSFISKLPHGSLCPPLFTSAAPDIDSASFLLDCVCLETSSHDVVLGSDWASYFRESLIASGKYVSHGFDAWMFFSSRLIGTSTVVSSQTPATVGHTSRSSLGATSHTSPPVRSTTGRSVHSDMVDLATKTQLDDDSESELDPEESLDEPDALKDPPRPWLDPDIPEPPMPMAGTAQCDLLLEPGCIDAHPETSAPVMICCIECRNAIKTTVFLQNVWLITIISGLFHLNSKT